jgi:PAP2 superfamily.
MTPLYAAVSAAFLLFYQAALYALIKLLQRGRTHYDVVSRLDERLPLVPAMVVPYVGSFVFWALTYYGLARSGDAFWPLTAAVLLGNTISDICFILLPTRMDRPHISGRGLFRFALRVVYFFDTPDNLFPSVHCLISGLCALAVTAAPVALIWKLTANLLALFIYASTVLVRQHRLADVPAGVALALICWLLCSRIPALPALAERIFAAMLY